MLIRVLLRPAFVCTRCRYDYEGVASEGAEAMMDNLRAGPAQPGDDLGSSFKLKGTTSVATCLPLSCWCCMPSRK